MNYTMKNKPMSKMKGDGMSGQGNEAIAAAGAKPVDYTPAAKMASPGSKPKQQA